MSTEKAPCETCPSANRMELSFQSILWRSNSQEQIMVSSVHKITSEDPRAVAYANSVAEDASFIQNTCLSVFGDRSDFLIYEQTEEYNLE